MCQEGPKSRSIWGAPRDRREAQTEMGVPPAAAAAELGSRRIMHLFILEKKVTSQGCCALTHPVKYSWNPNAKREKHKINSFEALGKGVLWPAAGTRAQLGSLGQVLRAGCAAPALSGDVFGHQG